MSQDRTSVKVSFKPHHKRDLINKLRDVSVDYADTQQLRAHIARTINDFIETHRQEDIK